MQKRAPLLTTNNFKTMKGEKMGYKTYILYLSPYTFNSTGKNVCAYASKGCAESCLSGSGFGGMYQNVKTGRILKTEYWLSERIEFLNQLSAEITKAVKKYAKDETTKVVFRLNGTSDISYESFKIFDGMNIFEKHSDVQFYDYTKNHTRFNKPLPANYHLTFSRSETNHDKAMELLRKGVNVAMVFTNTPSTYEGYKVINGDKDDLRFLDEKGVIVGLKYKKLTGKNADNSLAFKSGFAIRTKPVVERAMKRASQAIKNIENKLAESLVLSN